MKSSIPSAPPSMSTSADASAAPPGATRDGTRAAQARVWDIPVRVFHWLLVALFAVSWYTGKNGGVDEMTWHMWSGSALLALVVFRVVWGVVGSTSARFSHFLYGPKAAAEYANGLLRRRPPHYLGHTPLGGWMVVVMLASLLLQCATGLFANDDIITEGPFFAWVSKETSDWLTTIHKWNFDVLLILGGVHTAAVLYYLIVLRENLALSMFTGRKPLPAGAPDPQYRFVGAGIALVAGALIAGAVYALVW
ncbi:MAG: cytochrome b/b6 domain-containing protein [Proteobacteria bacterium]|nr:cytochrome b/b6 domain-containing protein [Burkholderiales bacterium]